MSAKIFEREELLKRMEKSNPYYLSNWIINNPIINKTK